MSLMVDMDFEVRGPSQPFLHVLPLWQPRVRDTIPTNLLVSSHVDPLMNVKECQRERIRKVITTQNPKDGNFVSEFCFCSLSLQMHALAFPARATAR